MLDELKGLTEQLSDIGSCVEELSSDSGTGNENSEEEKSGGFKTLNEKKRNKKTKRKLKLTPGKDQFLKKPNLTKSTEKAKFE